MAWWRGGESGETKSGGGGGGEVDDDRGNGRGKNGKGKIWRFVEGLCSRGRR